MLCGLRCILTAVLIMAVGLIGVASVLELIRLKLACCPHLSQWLFPPILLFILIAVVYGLCVCFSSRCRRSRVVGEPLHTKRNCDGRRILLCDLVINVEGTCIGKSADVPEIRISKGFKTDYSSIPTPLQWVVRWSKVDVAGVVHDWLYRDGRSTLSGNERDKRKCADEMWKEIALSGQHRATCCQATICWLALRLFGCWFWHKHRPKQAGALRVPDPDGLPGGAGVPRRGVRWCSRAATASK